MQNKRQKLVNQNDISDELLSNPYFDPKRLEEWRARIERLRRLTDFTAPWELEPNKKRWDEGLGPGRVGELNSHMLEWEVWLRSLTAQQRAAYQTEHPEPPAWEGFYRFTFSRPESKDVIEGNGPEAYWDSLARHYEGVFGFP